MSQKLPVDDLKWVDETTQFTTDFIENYTEDSDDGYFLEFDVQYPENVYKFHNDLSFLPERMKILKTEKLVANLHDKQENVVYI